MPEVIDSIKALAEMCGIFYEHLETQGFSKREALALTQTYLQSTLTPKPKAE